MACKEHVSKRGVIYRRCARLAAEGGIVPWMQAKQCGACQGGASKTALPAWVVRTTMAGSVFARRLTPEAAAQAAERHGVR